MKRRALALLASLLLLSAMPGSTLAAYSIVDQKMEELGADWANAKTFAQTFQNGQTGELTGVDLYLWNHAGASVTATIRGIDRATKVPVGASLATASKTVKDPNWYSFVFPTALNVLQNSQFAIVFTITGDCGAFGSSDAKYSRGSALVWASTAWQPWYNTDSDFAFRTWVHPTMPTLPPPAVATPTPVAAATPAPIVTAAPVVTIAPATTKAPAATLAPTEESATTEPSDAASLDATATTDPGAIALASTDAGASAAPSAGSEAVAGTSGNSDGGLPVLPILGLVVLLAAAMGAAFWFFVIRPRDGESPAERRPR